MRSSLRGCVALALSLVLGWTGCARWPANQLLVSPAALADAGPGPVRVELRDGSVLFVTHPAVRGDTLFGSGIGSHRTAAYAIPVRQIYEMSVLASDKAVSGAKTLLVVIVALIVIGLFIYYVYLPTVFAY
jgi:hypothetical protein